MALMRQLGRPSVLTLYDEAGQPAYALLLGMGSQSATLRLGGVTQTVGLVPLAKAWRGEFATLWRVPSGYEARLVNGRGGPLVDWLGQQLAKGNGDATPAPGQVFDAALQARITSFQLSQGLKPDGKVGPATLMQLNRVAGVDEPRLQAEMAAN